VPGAVSLGQTDGPPSPAGGNGSVLRLFLLLDVLNNPPKPTPPPPDDFADSSPSPDFLRESVKAPRSGDGLRPDLMEEGGVSRGSTMCETFDRSRGAVGRDVESPETILVWALISGEDKVK
jgi:hypothetical protein